MQKFIVLTIYFLLLSVFLEAQTWYPSFSIPNGGSSPMGVQYLNNNKYIVIGSGVEDITLFDANLQQEWSTYMMYFSQPWNVVHNPSRIFIDSLGNSYTPWSDPDPGAAYSAVMVVKLDSMGHSVRKLGAWSGSYIGALAEEWYDFNFDKIKNRILIVYKSKRYDQNQNLIFSENRFEVYDLNLDPVFTLRATAGEKVFVLYGGNDSQNYILIDGSGTVNTFDTNNNLLWRKKYGTLNPDGAVRIDSTIYWIAGNVLFKTDLSGVVTGSVSLLLPLPIRPGFIELNDRGNLVVYNLYNHLIVSELDTAFNVIHSLEDSSYYVLGLNLINGSNDMIAWGYEIPVWNETNIRKFNFDTYCDFNPYSLITQPYTLNDSGYSNITFPPSLGPLTYTNNFPVFTNSYTVNLKCSATGIGESADKMTIKISPNPSNSYFKISNLTLNKGDLLLMTDATGRCLLRKRFDYREENYKVETTGFSSGIYFLQAIQNNASYSGKVVLKK